MKLRILGIAALAGLLAPAAPVPAQAFPVTSCGGVWQGPSAECTFDFAGFPITIDAVAYADPIASVTIILTAEPRDLPLAPPIPLIACGAVRQENAGCHKQVGPNELTERTLFGAVQVTCRVAGVSTDSGTYRCESGFTSIG